MWGNMLVIDNKNGRNEQFLPLFSTMNSNGFGKLLDKRYYIIHSSMQVHHDNDSNTVFSLIQQQAIIRGFNYVMYYLHEK